MVVYVNRDLNVNSKTFL